MPRLVRNSATCLNCGDEIESKHRHDWVSCKCYKNEKGNLGIFIDGGLEYLRYGGCLQNYKSTCIWEDDENEDN
jgi:hypothetical protein